MGNPFSKTCRNKNDTSYRTKVDLPIMHTHGISANKVLQRLDQSREGTENTLEPKLGLAYNLIKTYDENIALIDRDRAFEPNTAFVDTVILGAILGVKGLKVNLGQCQDEVFCKSVNVNNEPITILGVFDGHGNKSHGHKVPKCCISLLEDIMEDRPTVTTKEGKPLPQPDEEKPQRPSRDMLCENPDAFFQMAFPYMHQVLSEACDFSTKEVGTTATCVSIKEKRISLAWVGDSQAAIFVTSSDNFDDFVSFNVTSRHNFRTDKERTRIRQNGGRLGYAGGNNIFAKMEIDPFSATPIRVFNNRGNQKPGLMISKSIGDRDAHELGLTAEPDVLTLDFNNIKTIMDLKDAIPGEFNEKLILRNNDDSFNSGRVLKKKGGMFSSTLGRIRTLGRKRAKSTSSEASPMTGRLTGIESSAKTLEVMPNQSGRLGTTTTVNANSEVDLDALRKEIKHCVIIAASDGLWDHFTKEEISECLGEILQHKFENKSSNVSLELGLKAIEKFRRKNQGSQSKNDDISVATAVLF